VYGRYNLIRLLVAGVFVLGDLYLLGLWIFAFMRTGKNFFLLLAASTADAAIVAIINVGFAYDLPGIRRLDPSNLLYAAGFFVLPPLALLLAIVGQTIFVRWALRGTPGASEPPV
jgi:hypothetical protein